MITIYHHSRCRKSRAGLEFLKSKQLDFEIIDYIKQPITEKQVREIITKTGLSVGQLLRKQEEVYKTQIKNKGLTDSEIISLFVEYPALLQRPILISGQRAVIADPPEKLNDIL